MRLLRAVTQLRRSQKRIEGTFTCLSSSLSKTSRRRSQKRIEGCIRGCYQRVLAHRQEDLKRELKGLTSSCLSPGMLQVSEDLKRELKAWTQQPQSPCVTLPKISKENWRLDYAPSITGHGGGKISKENWRKHPSQPANSLHINLPRRSQKRIEGSGAGWTKPYEPQQGRSQKRIEGSRCMLRRLWSRPREDLKGELKVMSLMHREF